MSDFIKHAELKFNYRGPSRCIELRCFSAYPLSGQQFRRVERRNARGRAMRHYSGLWYSQWPITPASIIVRMLGKVSTIPLD